MTRDEIQHAVSEALTGVYAEPEPASCPYCTQAIPDGVLHANPGELAAGAWVELDVLHAVADLLQDLP